MSLPSPPRPAAFAGQFYPLDPVELAAAVDDALATATPPGGPPPKALVLPHAGYAYSGPVAASGYRTLEPLRRSVHRVVLLGPTHRVPLTGLAVSPADAFVTPLGAIAIDRAARDAVCALPDVVVDDEAHTHEHSLEVHLPFLQRALDEFTLLPLVVGRAQPDAVAAVLDAVWGGTETLIVVSTDLSHYLDHATAARRDQATAARIVAGDDADLSSLDACGAVAVRGLLVAARRHHLRARLLDLRSSGDTGGDRSRVVGYGTFAFTPTTGS